MMQMTGAMTMLTGMALDDAPPALMNGMQMAHGQGMVNTMNGMAVPSRNHGIALDDVPVRHGAMEGMFAEPEAGGTPWTGGMQMGAGRNRLPFAGGMQMGAGSNGMPVEGDMPIAATGKAMPVEGDMPIAATGNGMPVEGGMQMSARNSAKPWSSNMPMVAGSNGMPAAGSMPMDAANNLPLYANLAMVNVLEMLRGIGNMPIGQSAKGTFFILN